MNLNPIERAKDQVVPIIENQFDGIVTCETAAAEPAAGADDIRPALLSSLRHKAGIIWICFQVAGEYQSVGSRHMGNQFSVGPAYSGIVGLHISLHEG